MVGADRRPEPAAYCNPLLLVRYSFLGGFDERCELSGVGVHLVRVRRRYLRGDGPLAALQAGNRYGPSRPALRDPPARTPSFAQPPYAMRSAEVRLLPPAARVG